MQEQLLERFLRYVSIDTQSDPRSETFPSTARQLRLLNLLLEEMIGLGLPEVEIDEHGYVTGTIPATSGHETAPVIGLLAHVDTSPDMSGAHVRPQLFHNYDGGDIALNDDVILRVADFPELSFFKGHTLITTDGTTLLGADDKAGVAEIMTLAAHLMAHPEITHGKIRIAFTPDEEIGRGVDYFDVSRFGAQFAYTVDGGFEGELEYENFNAAAADIVIRGRNIHPGYAKNKMINALRVAFELDGMIPAEERPEHTEGYEGFYHLTALEGGVETATLEYIIRDHDRAAFERRKGFLNGIVTTLRQRYGENALTLTLRDQYYNMKERIEPYPQLIEYALEAMKLAGVEPVVRPIRGGTDGSRLSYMGLPCPNLFTGGMNFHGRYEYCSLDTMERTVRTLIHLARLWGGEEQERNALRSPK